MDGDADLVVCSYLERIINGIKQGEELQLNLFLLKSEEIFIVCGVLSLCEHIYLIIINDLLYKIKFLEEIGENIFKIITKNRQTLKYLPVL